MADVFVTLGGLADVDAVSVLGAEHPVSAEARTHKATIAVLFLVMRSL